MMQVFVDALQVHTEFKSANNGAIHYKDLKVCSVRSPSFFTPPY